jgi:hypothetical protein
MRGLFAFLMFGLACCDGGPPTFSERIPDMPESERHRYCYNCQDKCFRDFQRTADDLYDWQKDWKKCLTKCSKRFDLDTDVCQYRDKEYLIHRKRREVPKKKKKKGDD